LSASRECWSCVAWSTFQLLTPTVDTGVDRKWTRVCLFFSCVSKGLSPRLKIAEKPTNSARPHKTHLRGPGLTNVKYTSSVVGLYYCMLITTQAADTIHARYACSPLLSELRWRLPLAALLICTELSSNFRLACQ
jgi:hypothetical protein